MGRTAVGQPWRAVGTIKACGNFDPTSAEADAAVAAIACGHATGGDAELLSFLRIFPGSFLALLVLFSGSLASLLRPPAKRTPQRRGHPGAPPAGAHPLAPETAAAGFMVLVWWRPVR
jgi:hypothetical protein